VAGRDSAPDMPNDVGIAGPLLSWFDRQARPLPWRRAPSPYRTLVSELMLQQTVVATVVPYFERFVARWPDVAALADAPVDDVLTMWSGLGYYARARNLHRAARTVVERHGGELPADETALRDLPGVGPYTAAAVAAIAFGQRTFALDGNAARVVARLCGVKEPIDQPVTRIRLRSIGQTWVPARRPGAFAEAVMELGATVCTPRSPVCAECPVRAVCRAHQAGSIADIPARTPRRPKRLVRVTCARVLREGKVLVGRHQTGLLAGMWSLPGSDAAAAMAAGPAPLTATLRALGVTPRRVREAGEIRHVFTHRDVTATVFDVTPAHVAATPGDDTRWVDPSDLSSMAVSSFLRKLLSLPPTP
jgi:A/G-specific adenine glycosylase